MYQTPLLLFVIIIDSLYFAFPASLLTSTGNVLSQRNHVNSIQWLAKHACQTDIEKVTNTGIVDCRTNLSHDNKPHQTLDVSAGLLEWKTNIVLKKEIIVLLKPIAWREYNMIHTGFIRISLVALLKFRT